MLIAKGTRIGLILASGKTLKPGGVLLHDPEGEDWPRCSGLIMPIERTSRPINGTTRAKEYIGRNVRLGWVNTPPKQLSAWHRIGKVVGAIDYTRSGKHADDYRHDFKEDVTAYRRGRAVRLELGSGCTWNWRGFVRP
jgi:hypothetical protein